MTIKLKPDLNSKLLEVVKITVVLQHIVLKIFRNAQPKYNNLCKMTFHKRCFYEQTLNIFQKSFTTYKEHKKYIISRLHLLQWTKNQLNAYFFILVCSEEKLSWSHWMFSFLSRLMTHQICWVWYLQFSRCFKFLNIFF